MQDFEYMMARSLDETVSLLAQEPDGVQLLSGGTDLLVQLREGRRIARLVVDIKSIPELNELTCDPVAGLRLGAAVPCRRICQHPVVTAMYPGLIDAFTLIGGVQIQGRASIGGNLCNASPAADAIPALIVHHATCCVLGVAGQREIPVEQFCMAPGQTALRRGELLVSLHIPPPGSGFGAHYLRFIPRNEMDIAVTGAAASVMLDPAGKSILSARVALGAVAPTPLFVAEAGDYLKDKAATKEAIAESARIAQAAARPINDMRGTAAQRRHLAGVLTRRALEKAIERARV